MLLLIVLFILIFVLLCLYNTDVSDTTSKHMEVSNEKKTSHRPNQDTEKPLNTAEKSNTEVKVQSKLQQDMKDDSVSQKSNSENIEHDANPELARFVDVYFLQSFISPKG